MVGAEWHACFRSKLGDGSLHRAAKVGLQRGALCCCLYHLVDLRSTSLDKCVGCGHRHAYSPVGLQGALAPSSLSCWTTKRSAMPRRWAGLSANLSPPDHCQSDPTVLGMALGCDELQSFHSIYPSPFCANLFPNHTRKKVGTPSVWKSPNRQLRTIRLKWQYVLPRGLPVVLSLDGSCAGTTRCGG